MVNPVPQAFQHQTNPTMQGARMEPEIIGGIGVPGPSHVQPQQDQEQVAEGSPTYTEMSPVGGAASSFRGSPDLFADDSYVEDEESSQQRNDSHQDDYENAASDSPEETLLDEDEQQPVNGSLYGKVPMISFLMTKSKGIPIQNNS
jgi:hypothetical protein